MVKAVFDTNILIDFLHGLPQARAELGRYEKPGISIITWMEVMAGAAPDTQEGTRAFLSAFELIDLTRAVAEHAVRLRRDYRIKLPDAIIWASAVARSALLVSRDEKAFPQDDPGVRIPYRL
jgi:predicted nucleic acid-binding protein